MSRKKEFEPTAPEGAIALTEQRNPLSEDIDTKSSLEIVDIFHREDAKIADAIHAEREGIAAAIDWTAGAFRAGGRLVYVGAGTSGRLGVLDAAECPPTFGTSPSMVRAIIAGGEKAFVSAVEGAEDDRDAGKNAVRYQEVGRADVVVGIASGSTTPFVHGALEAAKKAGAKTVLIACTPLAAVPDYLDLSITLLVGPELVTGSTRMKAGTATKMVLNMISTGSMILSGRTYGNLMVDLSCSNNKLVRRGIRIVESVTRLPRETAETLLADAQKHVKTALAMDFLGVDAATARRKLDGEHGFLRQVLRRSHRKNRRIDAVIFDMDGTVLRYGLPNGFSTWAALGWGFSIYGDMEKWVKAYLAGKISYDRIWRNCAQKLKGRPVDRARDVLFPCAGAAPLSRGFSDAAALLRGKYKLGILSSGLSVVAREVKKSAGLDFEVSNHLGTKRGAFDGTYKIRVPFDHKLGVFLDLCKRLRLDPARVCFVGDSPNDEEVLRSVGLPVAYCPSKPSVTQAARGYEIGDFLFLPKLIEGFEQNTID